MHFESKSLCRLATVAASCLVWTAAATAQMQAPPSDVIPLSYDSGSVQNTGLDLEVVHSFPVHVDNASWLRLHFSALELSGDVGHGTGSFLRITSMLDGDIQTQNSVHAEQWDNSSAYFNGDAVLVEILAYPGTGTNRIALKSVVAGMPQATGKSQCGGSDDRVPTTDVRTARLLPMGCTGWIINDACGCFLSAGHCGVSGSTVAEFNVPNSTSSGSLVHPPASDQYSVDNSSVQDYYYTIGNDWAYFGTYPNTQTGLTARDAQGDEFAVIQPPGFSSGQQIRITGYGVDYNDNVRTQTNQTHSGARVSASGTIVEYTVDTEGGNSGSPVIFESTGEAIGIHTNGGCSPPSQGNTGCGLNNSGVQNAMANPQGVCSDTVLANFNGSPTNGIAPLAVNFNDTSIGDPTTWFWNFGDGYTSSTQNPSHVYSNAGTYSVSLTASKPGSSDSLTRSNYIEVYSVIADFTGTPTSGVAPLTVAFSDNSVGTPTSWLWNFGDGYTSNLQNPSHTYTNSGTFTVSLTATKAGNSDTRTRNNYIHVLPASITASATSRNGSGVNPDIFTSTSLPILGTNWTSEVDAGSVGVGGFVFVFVYAGGLPGTPTAFGELLLDPSAAWLFTDLAIAAGGTSYHSIAVPSDPAFAGGTASAQGYLNNSPPSGQLTNAVDLVLGY